MNTPVLVFTNTKAKRRRRSALPPIARKAATLANHRPDAAAAIERLIDSYLADMGYDTRGRNDGAAL